MAGPAASLRPLQCARLLGLAPYRADGGSSWRGSLWAALLAAVLAAYDPLAYYLARPDDDILALYDRFSVLLLLRYTLPALLSALLVLHQTVIQGQFRPLLRALAAVDAALAARGAPAQGRRDRRTVVGWVLGCASVATALGILGFHYIMWKFYQLSKRVLFLYFLNVVFSFFLYGAASCIFCCYLYIIKDRFRLINAGILQSVIDTAAGRRGVYYEQDHPQFLRTSCAHMILEVKDIHMKLCSLYEAFTKMYSLCSVLIFCHACTLTVLEMHFTYIAITRLENRELLFYCGKCLYMLYFGFWLWAMAHISDTCIGEAKRSGKFIFRIRIPAEAQELRSVVRLFALQLLRVPRPLCMAGVFHVNKGLIASVYASIFTWLIITVQFDQNSANYFGYEGVKILSNVSIS